jgi:hypothetical protein
LALRELLLIVYYQSEWRNGFSSISTDSTRLAPLMKCCLIAFASINPATASVICRFEHGDYDGHSMAMLRRVADALGQRIEVKFVPTEAHALHA